MSAGASTGLDPAGQPPPPEAPAGPDPPPDLLVEHVDLADDGLDQIPRPFWRSMGASFAAAFAGLARTIATQRNMKIHVVAAFMVLLVGMALELDLATRAALIFCTGAVWFAEILNSSLEALVDLHIRQFHRLAMLAKDAAAAGVLVLAGGGVLILAEVVRAHWGPIVAARDQVALFLGLGVPATVCLGLVLWGNRKGPLAWTWTALALLCLVPLGLASVDRLFTACAVGTVLLGRYARVRFPGTMPRGQPIPPGAARPQPPPSSVRAVRRP